MVEKIETTRLNLFENPDHIKKYRKTHLKYKSNMIEATSKVPSWFDNTESHAKFVIVHKPVSTISRSEECSFKI